MLVESFEHASTRQRFADFCQWLKGEMGARSAMQKLKTYLSFFSFLDRHVGSVPSYASLLDHFTADGLRRMQRPMRWLKIRYGVEPDIVMREEHSEKRRMEQMIKLVPAGLGADTLAGYRSYLQIRQAEGRTTVRSARMSLRAAINVLAATSSAFDALPTQKSVTAFLAHTPGQAAVLQGFISYLNRLHGSSLVAEVNGLAKARARAHKLEAELLALYESEGEGEAFERTWIKTALMHLHGLASLSKKAILYHPQDFQGRPGFAVELKGKQYWVPSPADRPNSANLNKINSNQ